MKDINHIVLDFEKKTQNTENWSLNFLSNSKRLVNLNENYVFKKTHFINPLKSKLLINQKKNTTTYLNKLSTTQPYTSEDTSSYFTYVSYVINLGFTKLKKKNIIYDTQSDLYKLTNVNFLRKERLYTKLKYSRSPAYDIVSGGAAALLAGFIGFLIQEKYGFELVDSGDFYYLFMYLVFLVFSLRPLLTAISTKEKITNILSISFVLNFYQKLLYVFIKIFKY